MTPLTYRLLIVASILLGLAGGLVDTFIPSLLPAAFAAAMEAHEPSLPMGLAVAAGVVGLVDLAALVGLWLFRPWAPRCAPLATVLKLALVLPQDGGALSAWSMNLMDLSSMLWGAVLAVTFFSPLRARFARTPA